MFLKQFIYVNWGNIPNGEFEFGPINLFSGGNGSGKTTAADAIQTVMTAAHENLFQYNPGQNETTQRGSGGKRVRTLASYVLGCDDGSYARTDTSDGYLAAVFHPTSGETAPPFTAIIGVRAWLESNGNQTHARHDEAVFYILPGEQLTLGHFQREDKGGHYAPRAIALARRKLKQAGIPADVQVNDVTQLKRISGPFDLAFDLGCYHGISQDGRAGYLQQLDRILAPGGFWLMYGFFRTEADEHLNGLTEAEITRISSRLTVLSRREGIDDNRHRASAWFLFQKKTILGEVG